VLPSRGESEERPALPSPGLGPFFEGDCRSGACTRPQPGACGHQGPCALGPTERRRVRRPASMSPRPAALRPGRVSHGGQLPEPESQTPSWKGANFSCQCPAPWASTAAGFGRVSRRSFPRWRRSARCGPLSKAVTTMIDKRQPLDARSKSAPRCSGSLYRARHP
jgi:hypothetical protein